MSNPASTSTTTIGISLSSDLIELVAIDDGVRIGPSRRAPFDPSRSVADQIHELILEHDVLFRAIGIAVPGIVDLHGKIVQSRMTHLSGLELCSELGELVDGHIVVENDANAAAFAEWKVGSGDASKDIFRISMGEGVGSGLVLKGSIWRGSSGFAGELGSMVIDDEGNRLEDIASVPSIVRRTRNRFHQDNTSILKKLDENKISLKDISEAAALEDDLALLMFERTGVAIGTAVAAVLNILNIEHIVLAGEPARSNAIMLQAVSDRVKECTPAIIFDRVEIVSSELDDDAAAIGAGLLAEKDG